MTMKIDSINNVYDYDLHGIFSTSDIDQLMEFGREIRQEEAVDILDLSSLFSRVQIPNLPGITLKDHLITVSKMFPVSKYPDVWCNIIMGPTQEESLKETLGKEELYLMTGFQEGYLEKVLGIAKSCITNGLALVKNTGNVSVDIRVQSNCVIS